MAADEGCESDVLQRMIEAYRGRGALKSVLNNRGLQGINAKNSLNDGVIVPTALQGAEELRSAKRRKVNVLEMMYLKSFVAVSRMDRVRNEEVRMRAVKEMELASRTDQRVLRRLGT